MGTTTCRHVEVEGGLRGRRSRTRPVLDDRSPDFLGRRRSPELRRQRPLVGVAARCGRVGVGVVWPFFGGAIAVFAARARVYESVFAFVLYRHLILLRPPLTGSNVSILLPLLPRSLSLRCRSFSRPSSPQTANPSSPTIFYFLFFSLFS